jgi:hypothetical protein
LRTVRKTAAVLRLTTTLMNKREPKDEQQSQSRR